MLVYDLINEGGVRLEPHRRAKPVKTGDLLFVGVPGGGNVLVLKVLAPLRDRTAGQLLVRNVIEL